MARRGAPVSPLAPVARATLRRIARTALDMHRKDPSMSRAWYVAFVKHYYACQGVPLPEDLLLH